MFTVSQSPNRLDFADWPWHLNAGLYVVLFLVTSALNGLIMLWVSSMRELSGEHARVTSGTDPLPASQLKTATTGRAFRKSLHADVGVRGTKFVQTCSTYPARKPDNVPLLVATHAAVTRGPHGGPSSGLLSLVPFVPLAGHFPQPCRKARFSISPPVKGVSS